MTLVSDNFIYNAESRKEYALVEKIVYKNIQLNNPHFLQTEIRGVDDIFNQIILNSNSKNDKIFIFFMHGKYLDEEGKNIIYKKIDDFGCNLEIHIIDEFGEYFVKYHNKIKTTSQKKYKFKKLLYKLYNIC